MNCGTSAFGPSLHFAATRQMLNGMRLDSLDKVVGERCITLMQQRDLIRASTLFHWWPAQRAKK
jgi:hypothetical protein